MTDVLAVVPLRVLAPYSDADGRLFPPWSRFLSSNQLVCLVRGSNGVDVYEFMGWKATTGLTSRPRASGDVGHDHVVGDWSALRGTLLTKGAELGAGWPAFVKTLLA